jgi:hypothetical protein
MEDKNPDREQQRVDGEGDHSCCSSESRPERCRKHQSLLTAVEKYRQCASQYNAKQWNDRNDDAEYARFERGANGNSPVHRTSGDDTWTSKICTTKMPGMNTLRRNLIGPMIHTAGASSIWSRYLHVDLRSAALRTKRAAILDRRSTLLAGVFHVFEASAQRTGEQGGKRSGH